MIVSFKKQFIFVAVPKTASQSIRTHLRQYLATGDWEQSVYSQPRFFPVEALANFGHGHLTFRQVKPYLLPNMTSEFFSFAFVRNPYDRLVSFCSFYRDIHASMLRDPAGTMKSVLTNTKLTKHVFIAPQHQFICEENGDLAVSFVGKFENLQQDFDHVCREIDLPLSMLPLINRSERQKTFQYFDSELLEMVQTFYHKDFELFDYRKCIPTTI